MEYRDIAPLMKKVSESIAGVIVDKEDVIEKVLVCLLAGGHVLLEDVPGTGKTVLSKALAASVGGGHARIQFTPDLLPSDITGVRVWHARTDEFRFEKGPVFTNILLADEINRATPRTQSAMLECMEEKRVTEGGVTYDLPGLFFVIATQNPVETQGTFPLPEAQLDRFMMKLSMGYPSPEGALDMMRRFENSEPLSAVRGQVSADEILLAGGMARRCRVSDDLIVYIRDLCEAARDPEQVSLGPGPRAMLMLMKAAKSLAAIRGREYVIPDDIKELAVPVLAHRTIPRGLRRGQTGEGIIRGVLEKVPVPAEQIR